MPITWTNGYPFFYRVVGRKTQQPPIVLIHGLASSHKDWLLQMPALCQNRQIILVDLPGHGRSGCKSSYNIPAMADDIYRLLNELGIPQCDVMAISMGGMVAMSLASARPAQVRKLILVNTAPSLQDLVPSMRYLLPLRNIMGFIPMPILARALLRHMLPGRKHAAVRHHALKYWQQNNPTRLAHILGCLTGTDLWPQLEDIRAETLIIHGQHDSFSLASAMAMCRTIPKAEMITVKNSGHATVADQHARFNELMTGFLNHKHQVLEPFLP
ncbi:alpha/beta fold hydrolase [Parendozoicomonas haliclonae]|uniref:2-hydroxymuconate semialdehyde hydrolase n=1 Tax=Parendozoicomonas haliclonae TaxID=1960125 RepID=A0A1X7AK26_9GAMM|nr:alpha/beta hydrolase [Parendozoicomonas haliclonae]SMA42891.1 2-hydroxymuconate semialdehyde hydrolase [Parendozoicomonas haliclonae]